ncbi:MAG TPA: glycosyltransferase family A protein [Thermoanaerobaculia bacterium]|nr:glycosyltransferase family A protein [Thermoanaerobaculia bacterium]
MSGAVPPRTFSVVIPVFNADRYLGEAIRSALVQTRPPLEILVVDDGSTDSSRAVAERFGGVVRVLSGPNAGPSAARNRGVREARGSWIAFLDGDDRWEPEYLEAADVHLGANPGVGVLCFGVRVLEGGRPTAHVIHKRTAGAAYSTAGMLEGDVGTICTPLVARDVFLAVGGFDETVRANEDGHLWLRLSLVTEVHQDPRVLLLYRRHAENASGDLLANARESVRSLERLEAAHPEFASEFRRPMRRLRGKEYLRLGRELLVRGADLPAARAALRVAVTHRPSRLRGWYYLTFAYLPGGSRVVAAVRRRELALSLWWRTGSAAAAFRSLKRRVRAARA